MTLIWVKLWKTWKIQTDKTYHKSNFLEIHHNINLFLDCHFGLWHKLIKHRPPTIGLKKKYACADFKMAAIFQEATLLYPEPTQPTAKRMLCVQEWGSQWKFVFHFAPTSINLGGVGKSIWERLKIKLTLRGGNGGFMPSWVWDWC